MHRLLLLLLSFSVTWFCSAQSDDLTRLSGYVGVVSYHQGGIRLPDDVQMPKPYETSFWVVEYTDSAEIPVPVQRVETDSTGYFEVHLPPGKYGFATEEDLNKLRPGQILPTAYHTQDDYIFSNSYWTCSEALPLEMDREKSIVLNYYNVSVCNKCP